MDIINLTTKKNLYSNAKVADSILDQIFGLINHRNPRAIIFKTRWGIHTFFLTKPIDVLVLNNNFQVMKIKQSLPPFSLFFWNPRYSLLIELPNKTVANTLTRLGDKIKLKGE